MTHTLSEHESKQLLADAGIPIPGHSVSCFRSRHGKNSELEDILKDDP